ncbi:serine protease family protein [Aureliella helgolandensis]|uniref:Trypsin n=1 Tax=Aureliella helgolandensis TaxID=2527968 RepID=A0A518G311_9BACT|nr:trypsin-like peptidase domain-containing protein [Aureliella helgolandensis]QDV22929.1 hypothetical protein Q31a_12220 [Aureliella helgolandensis]
MKPFALAMIAILAITEFAGLASAQLLPWRRQAQTSTSAQYATCPPGTVCPSPGTLYDSGQVVTAQFDPGPLAVSPVARRETPEVTETAEVEADHPHTRCIYNGSCGSGTICGADGNGSFIVTNAHVTGTQLGRVVSVDCVVNGGQRRLTGRTVMTGYSDSRMVDFSIVYVEGLSSKRYMPMLKSEPDSPPFGTTGSPRCVWPLVVKQFNDARNYGDGLITGTPNAIGGQSGSAIYNSKGQQIALLTWSIGNRCAGQKTSKLWQVASQRNMHLADLRPQGLSELSDGDGERPDTSEGIFGSCALIETSERYRPETASVLASIAGSAMEDMPIWVVPDGEGPTDPDCPPCPPCPDCKPDCPPGDDCMVVTQNERELIEFLRAQRTAFGDGEKAFDWAKIISLILELIREIQEGRG